MAAYRFVHLYLSLLSHAPSDSCAYTDTFSSLLIIISRLLILVAASLQHSTISHELDQANQDCKKVQKRLQNASQFLERL